MINVSINIHHPEKFENDDREMVVILVETYWAKQDVHGTENFVLKGCIM